MSWPHSWSLVRCFGVVPFFCGRSGRELSSMSRVMSWPNGVVHVLVPPYKSIERLFRAYTSRLSMLSPRRGLAHLQRGAGGRERGRDYTSGREKGSRSPAGKQIGCPYPNRRTLQSKALLLRILPSTLTDGGKP